MKRHLDRRRRTLPPQWRDPRILPLPLPLLLLPSSSLFSCHPSRSGGSALAFAFAFALAVAVAFPNHANTLPPEAQGFSPPNNRRAAGATALPKAGVKGVARND